MICICMEILKYGKDFSLSRSISKKFIELNLYETCNIYDHELTNQTHTVLLVECQCKLM